MTYRCQHCGAEHAGVPLSYGVDAPVLVDTIPLDERPSRIALGTDQCIVDDKAFFILGNVEIPIIGHDDVFVWSVWVSLSEGNFAGASDLWTTDGCESEPPCFGWFSSSLPFYPETLNLKTMVHTRPVGMRPFVELEPTDHPLSVEQRNGITMARVEEIARRVAST